ncbi:DNA-(apurinic or apyrimidinic site) endonuclease [Caerostris darwini]|uniref:DNA-(apurinic or apyrimidinic site) endonuclease n=1 Tax=Caerostris darwini TaxID=1538125 RepID=A0AAV4SHT0_9ARAC|nr:DNA-(apurinic or apyrimidinic site) endonuclease [Caerostris darwini]
MAPKGKGRKKATAIQNKNVNTVDIEEKFEDIISDDSVKTGKKLGLRKGHLVSVPEIKTTVPMNGEKEVKLQIEENVADDEKNSKPKRGRKALENKSEQIQNGNFLKEEDAEAEEIMEVEKLPSKQRGKKAKVEPSNKETAKGSSAVRETRTRAVKSVAKPSTKIAASLEKGKKKDTGLPIADGGVTVAINRNETIDKMALDQLKETTSRKRKLDDDDEDIAAISPPSKTPKKAAAKKEKSKIPDVTALDFDNECKSADGKPWNLKLASWNVNGIRAWLEKNGMSYLHHEKPDILCLQETKCSDDKLPAEANIEGYHCYWLAGDQDGYSDVEKHDKEGRVITAEYKDFYLVATYVPNAGRGLVRLDYRQEWDEDFRAYLKKLDQKKPVVLCGDLNVAHEEIDLANPKTNKKNAGFTKEEREGFSTLLSEGFVDTFRHLYPDSKGAYTFWTYMMNARAKNVGWRLDYFIVSKRFVENVCDSVIRKDVYGSDHCPITLFLHV